MSGGLRVTLRRLGDLPEVEPSRWLGLREQATWEQLRSPKRRRDWLLGRWTAKEALRVALGTDVPRPRLQIVAAADGAPEAFVGGDRAPVDLSLTHRAGVAACVVAQRKGLGCDLEVVEPRSPAFVQDWLTDTEQELVEAAGALAANLCWSAKESALKATREGLRRDTRSVVVTRADGLTAERAGDACAAWFRLVVEDRVTGRAHLGWWRRLDDLVLTVVGAPGPERPVVDASVA